MIVIGAGVLLLAPIAQMDVTIDIPANGGLPTFRDVETRTTPAGIAIALAAIVSIGIGAALLWRRRSS